MKNGRWVFGAVERGSNLTAVDSRDRDTLFPIIKTWIHPDTQIISDGFAAYQGFDHFDHGVYDNDVIHKENFVDPQDPMTHTQTIEGLWAHFKNKLGRVASKSNFGMHMIEFL